jgi:hypothetical protein
MSIIYGRAPDHTGAIAPTLQKRDGCQRQFSKTFPQRGPRDKQGRSLRDFDLKTRLFRYPLSYMIYSAAFDGMPDLVRDRVDILAGQDSSKSVDGLSVENLSADDRRAILEIVRETKLNLPSYWTAASAQ